jgi:hypothetical protein
MNIIVTRIYLSTTLYLPILLQSIQHTNFIFIEWLLWTQRYIPPLPYISPHFAVNSAHYLYIHSKNIKKTRLYLSTPLHLPTLLQSIQHTNSIFTIRNIKNTRTYHSTPLHFPTLLQSTQHTNSIFTVWTLWTQGYIFPLRYNYLLCCSQLNTITVYSQYKH